MERNKLYRDFDWPLAAIIFLIVFVGLITIFSATQAKDLALADSYFMKQINSAFAAVVLFIICISVSYQKFIDLSYIMYTVNIFLLILVLILGRAHLGAQRWFSVGGWFAFQPSEFIKLSIILALANYIGANKERMHSLEKLLIPALLLAIPFILVLIQPDLGTALILLPIFIAIIFVGGSSVKHIAWMFAIGLSAVPFLWHAMHDYQKQRFLVFVNPNVDPLGTGYAIIQSKIAVGSGGLFGKGWLNGSQSQLNFLPERHTDFIFSVFAEELGFLGAVALVLAYLFIVKRALNIAASTSDSYGKIIAVGVAAIFAMQAVINIGMTIGLMPVVGIPLPLFSYGGSSLIASLAALGLLINVSMRRSTF